MSIQQEVKQLPNGTEPIVVDTKGILFITSDTPGEVTFSKFIPFREVIQLSLDTTKEMHNIIIETSIKKFIFPFSLQPKFIVPEEDREHFMSKKVLHSFPGSMDSSQRDQHQWESMQKAIEETYAKEIAELKEKNESTKARVKELYTKLINAIY